MVRGAHTYLRKSLQCLEYDSGPMIRPASSSSDIVVDVVDVVDEHLLLLLINKAEATMLCRADWASSSSDIVGSSQLASLKQSPSHLR